MALALTVRQQSILAGIKEGINDTDTFVAELTNHHGGALTTEYMMTADIARRLLRRSGEVAVEFLASRMQNWVFLEKPLALGNQRFDIVNLYAGFPEFIIEVKIGVSSLNGIRKDLEKIIKFISSVQLQRSKGMLGASVFQTHYRARQRDSVPQTTKAICVIEESIRKSLSGFARGYPKFEFDWVELQQSEAGIYGDEVYEDALEGPTLGAFGHATRYHAVLLRRIA